MYNMYEMKRFNF